MVDQTPLISAQREDLRGPKIGHSCCGCFCDTRRAVILVQLIFQIILGTLGVVVYNESTVYTNWTNDPNVVKDLEHAYQQNSIVIGVGILVGFIVIFGAITYRASLILLGIVWFMIQTALEIFFLYPVVKDLNYHGSAAWTALIGPIVWLLILIYPHIVFFFEIKKGVMSAETYPRERQSCCCNV